MSAYERRHKIVKSHRETVLGLWKIALFDVPTTGKDCFLYTYLGLAPVIGGLPSDLQPSASENIASNGAAALRARLAARVRDMASRAVREGGTLGQQRMCVTVECSLMLFLRLTLKCKHCDACLPTIPMNPADV